MAVGQAARASGEVFAALDIGSSKIACFIARADGDGPPRVIGIGHQLAEGMRDGSVANMEAFSTRWARRSRRPNKWPAKPSTA